jgi:hypothetical protein
MKEIKLTKGLYAKVDDNLFEELNKKKWLATNGGYAARSSKTYFMHRFIINAPDDMEVDHIDGDKLNNQLKNLRICTKSQNQSNSARRIDSTSGYKGVCKNHKKWQAYIQHGNKRIYLGTWNTPEDAARAYDKAAKKLNGNFSRTNF